MRVSVIGCGHVGLVTGGCLGIIGHEVMCADSDAERIRWLQGGRVPIYESHLEEMIQHSGAAGTLTFTCDSDKAARASEVLFLCVGVPQFEDGQSDFSALDIAARQIAHAVDKPKLIVERSTVPVKTSKQLERLFAAYSRHRNAHFRVAASPQFLREGTAVEDFLHPDRILLGVEDAESERTLRQIYTPILEQSFHCPVHPETCPRRNPPELLVTNVRSAELIKDASNAFLGVKISYANVLADLCERLGANVQEVTHAVGLDPRIRPHFLKAGIGFGGYRLPKDLRAFCRLVGQEGVDAGILQAAENVNRSRIDVFFEKSEALPLGSQRQTHSFAGPSTQSRYRRYPRFTRHRVLQTLSGRRRASALMTRRQFRTPALSIPTSLLAAMRITRPREPTRW